MSDLTMKLGVHGATDAVHVVPYVRGERGPGFVTLELHKGGLELTLFLSSPDEARALAAKLVEAAAMADARPAGEVTP